jgi:hypothetical protein
MSLNRMHLLVILFTSTLSMSNSFTTRPFFSLLSFFSSFSFSSSVSSSSSLS